ncbi:hypothetical protein Droror1_Dr00027245 [Drosera rotundifolia]
MEAERAETNEEGGKGGERRRRRGWERRRRRGWERCWRCCGREGERCFNCQSGNDRDCAREKLGKGNLKKETAENWSAVDGGLKQRSEWIHCEYENEWRKRKDPGSSDVGTFRNIVGSPFLSLFGTGCRWRKEKVLGRFD